MALSCINSEKNLLLVEKCDYLYPLAFYATVRGGPRRSIAMTFGIEKLEWCGYQMVKKSFTIYLVVSTEYRRVADRQTDGQTDILPQHSPWYAYVSRGNYKFYISDCMNS